MDSIENYNINSYEYAKNLYIQMYGKQGNANGVPFYSAWNNSASVPNSLTKGVFIGYVTFSSVDALGNKVDLQLGAYNAIFPSEIMIRLIVDGSTQGGQCTANLYAVFDTVVITDTNEGSGQIAFMGWKFPLND